MPSFSQRHQYAQPPEISIREGLSSKLRRPIAQIAARRVGSKAFRQIVLAVLDPYGILPPPQAGAWVAIFVKGDVDFSSAAERFDGSPWFRVYDVIEAVHRKLARQDKQSGIPVEGAPHAPGFEREINRYFVHAGIG
jgi:hypothetical protein